jgi:hypothetical protein
LPSSSLFKHGRFALQGKEIVAVYLLLKSEESRLDTTMLQLLDRLERELYKQLTIDEFENLKTLYNKNI